MSRQGKKTTETIDPTLRRRCQAIATFSLWFAYPVFAERKGFACVHIANGRRVSYEETSELITGSSFIMTLSSSALLFRRAP